MGPFNHYSGGFCSVLGKVQFFIPFCPVFPVPRHQRAELHGELLQQTHAFQAPHGEENAQEEQGVRNLPVMWICLLIMNIVDIL